MTGFMFNVYYYHTFNQTCSIYFREISDGFTVDADGAGDQGTLHLLKISTLMKIKPPKSSWTTNTNKVQGGW